MLEVIDQIMTADTYTWSLAIALTLCAATLVREMSGSTALTVLYSPVLLFGALASAWLFRTFSLFTDVHHDISVIVATSIGMVVSLLPLLALTRFSTIVRDFFIRPPEHEIIVPRPSKMKKSIPEDRLAGGRT